jgi:hypothetical protein
MEAGRPCDAAFSTVAEHHSIHLDAAAAMPRLVPSHIEEGCAMSVQDIVQLLTALGIGSALPRLASFAKRRLLKDPKAAAEARKINAEASHTEWGTLRDEIDRLTATVRWQGREIADLREQADRRADREEALEKENRALRTQVGRLRRRVEGLEKILKVEVKITPEMQRLLDELPDDSDDAGSGHASD